MYERTPEIRKKISDALKKAHENKPGAWRKDYSFSDEHKQNLSKAHKDRKLTPQWIANRTKAQKGLKRTMETRLKLSKAKMGSNAPMWKGGVTKLNNSERKIFMYTFEYRNWRKLVFERDKYTCKFCGQVGGRLNADHIKPYALYPDLRIDVNNGRTLCEPCHRTTSTYGRSSYKEAVT